MTWEEARDSAGPASVAILPVGAMEAHGPHLPLDTDVIIAQAMARAGAARLTARGLRPLLLPPLAYTTAAFAQGFAGTMSLRPQTVTATVLEIAANLRQQGFGMLAIANAHLDPAHLGSLEAAAIAIRHDLKLPVAFPNLVAKPWALRLSDEFKSGACHAGQFETSIIMAERPELVRNETRAILPRTRRRCRAPSGMASRASRRPAAPEPISGFRRRRLQRKAERPSKCWARSSTRRSRPSWPTTRGSRDERAR